MKLRNAAIVWNKGKGDLLIADFPSCCNNPEFMKRRNSLGAVYTSWLQEPEFMRIYSYFINILQIMLWDKSITIEDVIKQTIKIDEFKCAFSDDIYEQLGLKTPEEDDIDEYKKNFNKEFKKYKGLK